MAKCQETEYLALTMGDEGIDLHCDLESGHAEEVHFDEIHDHMWVSRKSLMRAFIRTVAPLLPEQARRG